MKRVFLVLSFLTLISFSSFAQLTKADVETYFKLADLTNVGRVYIGVNSTVYTYFYNRTRYSKESSKWEYKEVSKFKLDFLQSGLLLSINDDPKLIPYQSIKVLNLFKNKKGKQVIVIYLL
jgi:hypothetical protein